MPYREAKLPSALNSHSDKHNITNIDTNTSDMETNVRADKKIRGRNDVKSEILDSPKDNVLIGYQIFKQSVCDDVKSKRFLCSECNDWYHIKSLKLGKYYSEFVRCVICPRCYKNFQGGFINLLYIYRMADPENT